MFNKLLFQSKFVFFGGGIGKLKSRFSTTNKSVDTQDTKELKSNVTKAKLKLATIARNKSFHDMTVKLTETSNEAYFYAAVDWAVKKNSPFYAKRDKILRALTTNDDFLKTVPARVCIQKYDVFNPVNVKMLLEKLSGNWIMKGMVEIARPKLPRLVKLMKTTLKALLKVIAQDGIKKYLRKAKDATPSSAKAVNYTKNLNKYQKVIDALEGKIQAKPASAATNAGIKTVPYRPPRTNKPIRTDNI